jgi:PhnB protein
MSTGEAQISPWLSVGDGARALSFYKGTFGAVEVERLEDGGRVVVAQLNVDGALMWIQEDPGKAPNGAVRMILTVDDPDAWFNRAIAAGAKEVAKVHEAHGWRTGRVSDPFGHDWEFSKRVTE